MSTLTVTAKGQVTLRKDILKHLGVHPGEKIAVDKAPRRPNRGEGRSVDRKDFGCLQFFLKKKGNPSSLD